MWQSPRSLPCVVLAAPGCGETGSLLCPWEDKLMQLPWRAVWQPLPRTFKLQLDSDHVSAPPPCRSAPSHRVSHRGCAGAPCSVSLLPLLPPKLYLNTFSVLNMFRVNISEQKPDHVICLSQSLLLASFHLLSFNEEQNPKFP